MDEDKNIPNTSKESLIPSNNNDDKNALLDLDNDDKKEIESNIASVLSQIEVTDELVEEILADKERHFDLLSLPADYQKAVDHFKATQFYNKDKMKTNEESKKNIILKLKTFFFINFTDQLFCDDCLNPIPQEENPPKLPICTDNKNLTELGTGVYLYFFFLKFIFVNLFLLFGCISVVEMYLAFKYNTQVEKYCDTNIFVTSNSKEVCDKFTSSNKDFLYQMSFENIRIYQLIVNNKDSLISVSNTPNVNLINFITQIVMLLINLIVILIVNNLEMEAEYKVITSQDYTLYISDIHEEELTDNVEILKNEILEIDGVKPIEINTTYEISGYINLKNDFKNLKQKLRTMHINKVSFKH